MGRRANASRRGTSARAARPQPGPETVASTAPRDACPRAAEERHTIGAAQTRWTLVDCARGAAIVAMIAYHACFDLAHFGWMTADFNNDWRWLAFRAAILSSFLAISGVSLALAATRGIDAHRFWRRIATIAGAALLVSAGSYAMFPQSFIWFGVLHAIVVMSIVTRYLLPLGTWLLAIGGLVVAAGALVATPAFDHPALQWIGMMTFKPRTEDYVPLFPWLGAMLIGAGAGFCAVRRRALVARLSRWEPPVAASWLPWLGRHSLVIYLAHQPLLIGALMLAKGV